LLKRINEFGNIRIVIVIGGLFGHAYHKVNEIKAGGSGSMFFFVPQLRNEFYEIYHSEAYIKFRGMTLW
jgi:hypothetical protein